MTVPDHAHHSVVDVWLVPTPLTSYDALKERYGHWLSEDERERLRLQRTPKGANAFLLTRIALRAVLSLRVPAVEPGQWKFERTARGRPAAINITDAPDFNLSHADDALVIATAADGKLGVDIESLAREVTDAERLARRYFHPDEVAALLSLPVEQQLPRFLTLWTLKEACVKATGQGLANALQEFYFRLEAPPELQCPRFDCDGYDARERRWWRAWSGVLTPSQGARFRVSLAWRLGSEDLAGAASLRFRQLRFGSTADELDQQLISEPLSMRWQADWLYTPEPTR